jgi:phage terminase large subunit-like protein
MSSPSAIAELQRIVLTEDLPVHGLKTGDVGTVVHVAADGRGYVVEFCSLSGETVAVVPVEPFQIRSVEQREVANARRLAG